VNRKNIDLVFVHAYLGKVFVTAFIYYLAGQLGYLFPFFDNGFPLIWPPSAVALGALLLLGNQELPGILLGAFATAFFTGAPLTQVLAITIGYPLAAWISAILIRRNNGQSFSLSTSNSVLSLILFGAVLNPLISSIISVSGILIGNGFVFKEAIDLWFSWWVGDALGVLAFTPLLLVWLGSRVSKLTFNRVIERTIAVILIITLEWVIFHPQLPTQTAVLLSFLVFPLLVLSVLRLTSHSITLLFSIVLAISIWGVTLQRGPFSQFTQMQRLLYLGITFAMYITSLYLTATIAERREIENELSRLSTLDNLTGLYNHLFFETEMKRLNHGRQYPVSIIYIDVDNLKQINDKHGHHEGDQLLKEVAGILTTTLRSDDIIARIGGDEFAVLLPSTSNVLTKQIVRRLLNKLSEVNQLRSQFPIQVSIGVATARKDQSIESALKLADNHMYGDKRKRNQIKKPKAENSD